MTHARRLAPIAALAIAPMVALLACNAVLGLDSPSLDPCAGGGCADGSGDASAIVDGATGEAAPLDAGSDRGVGDGVRCGALGPNAAACGAAEPTCCGLADDAGSVSYACTAADACAGFAIGCTSNEQCPGNDVCCHSSTRIRCVGQSSCNGDSLVCEPDGAADQCPSGWSCKVAFVIDGVPAPYFACAP